jgi:hypothetical protein
VIVVADCDMLFDRFWISGSAWDRSPLGCKTADNGDFVIGALDNLSARAISSCRPAAVRSAVRPRSADPRDAEQQYQARENDCRKAPRHGGNTKLQKERPDAQGIARILSPEQQAQIEKFRVQMGQTRKEPHEVQHPPPGHRTPGVKLRVINMG